MLRGLPGFLRAAQYPFLVAVGGAGALAGAVALARGPRNAAIFHS
jgi:hypothetical protein